MLITTGIKIFRLLYRYKLILYKWIMELKIHLKQIFWTGTGESFDYITEKLEQLEFVDMDIAPLIML